MRYYMIEQQPEDVDEPCRIYLELNDGGIVQRKIEVYENGIHLSYDTPEETPADLFALSENGQRITLTSLQFDAMWGQTREIPDGFMNLFF